MLPAVPAVARSSCAVTRKNTAQARVGAMLVLDAGAFVAVERW